jgi:hypothetical protein
MESGFYRRALVAGCLILLVVDVAILTNGNLQIVKAQDTSLQQILNPPPTITSIQPASPGTIVTPEGSISTGAPLVTPQGVLNNGVPVVTPQGVLNNGVPVVTPQGVVNNGLVVNGPFACASTGTPGTNQVLLTINKFVNSNGLTTVSPLTNLQFQIQVNNPNNGQSDTFILTAGGNVQLCVTQGQSFNVVESDQPTGLSFSTTYTTTTPTLVSTTDHSCFALASNVIVGQGLNCTITNTLQSGQISTNSSNNIVNSPNSTPPQSSTRTRTFVVPQGFPNSATTSDNPFLAQSAVPTNPPFQTCATNEGTAQTSSRTGLTSTTSGGITTTQLAATTRIPSAMTIVISGKVDLDSLGRQLQSWGTKSFNIVLKSDLQQEDGVMTQIANPRLEGEVVALNDDGAKQKVFNFVLSDVRTECKFITLAQAFGPAPNTNIAPLGQLGKVTRVNAPSITKELLGGVLVGTSPPAKTLPTVLNPPFATCQATGPSGTAGTAATGNIPDNLALYVMKGDAKDISKISGNTLTVELTADIQPSDTDLAKIVNANNPYLVANLIADAENINQAHRIDFSLTDVTTDCKQMSLTTKSIFNIFPNELSP